MSWSRRQSSCSWTLTPKRRSSRVEVIHAHFASQHHDASRTQWRLACRLGTPVADPRRPQICCSRSPFKKTKRPCARLASFTKLEIQPGETLHCMQTLSTRSSSQWRSEGFSLCPWWSSASSGSPAWLGCLSTTRRPVSRSSELCRWGGRTRLPSVRPSFLGSPVPPRLSPTL